MRPGAGPVQGRGLGWRGGAEQWAGCTETNRRARREPRPDPRGGCCIVMSAGRRCVSGSGARRLFPT